MLFILSVSFIFMESSETLKNEHCFDTSIEMGSPDD